MVLGGLVTLLNLVLSVVVAVRLCRLGWGDRRLPELALATYFLMSAVIGTIPQLIVYSHLADPSLGVPDGASRVLLGIAVFGMAVGAGGVYLFTWRTFRPDRPWARAVASAGCAALAVGFAIELVAERFSPAVFPGPGHWLGWAARTGAMLAVALESLGYWARLRRRLRLGLAEPLVANRFLLWGVWAAASFLNYVADLAARGVYVLRSGSTTELIPEAMAPIIHTTLFATMALGLISAVTLFLTFFPTAGYARWVQARSAARPA